MPVRLRDGRPDGKGKRRKPVVPLGALGQTVATLPVCSNANCVHGLKAIRDYRSTLDELWDQSFANRVAIAAGGLYRAKYNVPPPLVNDASRSCYPCGIIEQAYLDLRDQGVPLIKPLGPIGRARLSAKQSEA